MIKGNEDGKERGEGVIVAKREGQRKEGGKRESKTENKKGVPHNRGRREGKG